MREKRIGLLLVVSFLVISVIVDIIDNKNLKSYIDSELIYEEEVSPNKEYMQAKKEIILYNIKIYQKKDNRIIVRATSNFEIFEDINHEVEYDKKISSSDVKIIWGTLMGDQNFAKDNQMI